MIRVLIISDFTESFSHKLLAGIVDYSRQKEQWIVRRMPPEYKAQIGIPGRHPDREGMGRGRGARPVRAYG